MMETSRASFVRQYEPDVASSIWIMRPADEIWSYLAEVSNEPQWRDIMKRRVGRQFAAELEKLKTIMEA